MHWIGPTLLVLSLILLPLALRGRLTARGLFCRRCKFDLQGLDPARPNPTCPECGRSLSWGRLAVGQSSRPRIPLLFLHPKPPTIPTFRRAHRLALAAALLLLLSGMTLLGRTVYTNRLTLLDRLPARPLILLEGLGLDAARTTIAQRADDQNRFTDAQWEALLTRALAHQADTTTPWDPRWGNVLARGLMYDRMTQAQLKSYVQAVFTPTVRIRDRAALDQPSIAYSVRFPAPRFQMGFPPVGSGLSWGTQTQFKLSQKFTRTGLEGLNEHTAVGGGNSGMLVIPWIPLGAPGDVTGFIPLHGFNPHDPPGEVTAFIEIQTELTDTRTGQPALILKPQRFEQTIRLLPAGTEIIATVRNEAEVRRVRASARLSDLRIDPSNDAYQQGRSIEASISLTAGPGALAGRIFIVSADAQEIELSPIAVPRDTTMHTSLSAVLPPDPDDPAALERIRALLRAGKADLVFRTDPTVALDEPTIDEMLDITIRFLDIPVVPANAASGVWQYSEDLHTAENDAPLPQAD